MPGELIRGDCIVGGVAVTQQRYRARGWGVGEVWAQDGVLVLHELAGTVAALQAETAPGAQGQAASGARGALPPMGGARAPTGTLARKTSRETNGFVPGLCRRFARHLGGAPTSYDDDEINE
jgi:hypothetical protein